MRRLVTSSTPLCSGFSTNTRYILRCKPARTVSPLAREARVGRNAIYSNHRVIIEALRAGTPTRAARSTEDELGQRAMIETLKAAERRLITENAALLKRALDAEAEADRHRRLNARLIAERDAMQRPRRIR